MHLTVVRLNSIKSKIKEVLKQKQHENDFPEIIAVSKTFTENHIMPLIIAKHIHFGENKVQEAETKWVLIKKKYPQIKLHMVGKLQSNKAKQALILFDFIHSLDSEKLAKKISQYESEFNKKIKYFIQVNIGGEVQKAGIATKNLESFYNYCVEDLKLNVIGLMCLPPQNDNPAEYFKNMNILSEKLGLKNLSMGMSDDYLNATEYGATHLRLGTQIFGSRNTN